MITTRGSRGLKEVANLRVETPARTFFATKRTTNSATAKHPAATLAETRLVEARMRTIPQNDEPRSKDYRTASH